MAESATIRKRSAIRELAQLGYRKVHIGRILKAGRKAVRRWAITSPPEELKRTRIAKIVAPQKAKQLCCKLRFASAQVY